MKLTLLKKNYGLCLISSLMMSGLLTQTSHALDFACQDDITPVSQDAKSKAAADVLYEETIEYLRGFINLLTEKSASCQAGAEAITQSHTSNHSETCLSQEDDVVTLIEQSKVILDNPETFRACFDTQKDYSDLELFTPNKKMQETSFVANSVNRHLLTEYYKNMSSNKAISGAGQELSENFIQIISNVTYDSPLRDMSYLELNHLWSSVGWLPMYSKRPDAINERFRGSYVYAEVVGPWGLLRVKSINGKPYGLELGMTVQLADSFYPYHFHQPQEIYIDISNRTCLGRNIYTLSDWETFGEKTKLPKGYDVSIPSNDNWQQLFAQPGSDDILYIDRNNIHGFHLIKTCDHDVPQGMVTIWSRTTAHEFEQETKICSVTDERYQPGKQAEPGYSYKCDLHKIPQ